MTIAYATAQPRQAPRTRPDATPDVAVPEKRVFLLVVDDDHSVRLLLGRALADDGIEIMDASNAAEAGRIAAERCPDLVVADVVMPGRSGIELRRELMELCPKLPVILISGYSPEHVAEFVARTPATTFLPKPFTIAALRTAVDEALLSARGAADDRPTVGDGA